MLTELKKLKIKNFLLLIIAGAVNATGVTMFLAPINLYDSGISGTSMLLDMVTPEYLSLSVFLLILNIPLFLFGLKKQGSVFTVYAVFSVAMYSFFAWVINDVLPVDVVNSSPFAGTDPLLCALFGGMISGVGSGLAIRFGGAMDGIEVMAVIFAKKLGLTVGTFVMIYNVLLYIICGIIFASWRLPLYSIIAYMAALKTVDFIVEGLDRSKSATIITEKPDEVCAALSEAFECGITTMDAKGYYSGSEKTMVYIVLNRFQIGRMKDIVHTVDKTAYISISEIADVFKYNQK
ncbi:MAG: YitT family protein [Christensenellaceae bacterium]|nr:YitT family protein [Christensenellaceae bacterium]